MKKKNFAIIICAVLALCLALCACGNQSGTTTAQTTEAETTAQETTAEPTTSAGPTQEEMQAIAKELAGAYNTILRITSGAFEIDENTTYTDENGNIYSLVTEKDFQSVGDINAFGEKYFTESILKEKYPSILDPGSDMVPQYIYVQDEGYTKGLYMVQAGKGFAVVDTEAEIRITATSETTFKAELDFDNFGLQDTLIMGIVEEDGQWKINAIAYGNELKNQ